MTSIYYFSVFKSLSFGGFLLITGTLREASDISLHMHETSFALHAKFCPPQYKKEDRKKNIISLRDHPGGAKLQILVSLRVFKMEC